MQLATSKQKDGLDIRVNIIISADMDKDTNIEPAEIKGAEFQPVGIRPRSTPAKELQWSLVCNVPWHMQRQKQIFSGGKHLESKSLAVSQININ